ncbi:MAG: VOC family metalloprotein YjdN [Armatimonadota bacterium]|nr:VOC family metalloprotein YjdN [Armatimonadota bacterium]
MALRLNPYLVMNGNAQEAVAFYRQALGAEVLHLTTFGEMPPDPAHPIPEALRDRIMHAHLRVGETDLMLSDTFPGQEHQVGNQVTIALHTDDVAAARRIFDALAAGGRVDMPLQETFWSPAYGQVTDRFGVSWQVNTEKKG